MIAHVFSLICSGISIDADTRTISIFKVLEQLTVYSEADQPFMLSMPFEILSLWTRQSVDSPCHGKGRITFVTPAGVTKIIATTEVDLSQVIYHRSRLISKGLELTGPGKYQFIIELQQPNAAAWEVAARLPLLVIYQPASLAGQAQTQDETE